MKKQLTDVQEMIAKLPMLHDDRRMRIVVRNGKSKAVCSRLVQTPEWRMTDLSAGALGGDNEKAPWVGSWVDADREWYGGSSIRIQENEWKPLHPKQAIQRRATYTMSAYNDVDRLLVEE